MLKLLALNQIKANTSNPRTWTKKELSQTIESIKEFPQMLWVRPCVVNTEGVINGGNLRREAIKAVFELTEATRKKLYDKNAQRCNEKGQELARLFFLEKKIPVYVADEFTDEQEAEFLIKDNGSFGEWDFEELANSWSDCPLSHWGIKGLDFMEDDENEKKRSKPRKPRITIEFENDDDLGSCRALIEELLDKQGFDTKITASLEIF